MRIPNYIRWTRRGTRGNERRTLFHGQSKRKQTDDQHARSARQGQTDALQCRHAAAAADLFVVVVGSLVNRIETVTTIPRQHTQKPPRATARQTATDRSVLAHPTPAIVCVCVCARRKELSVFCLVD